MTPNITDEQFDGTEVVDAHRQRAGLLESRLPQHRLAAAMGAAEHDATRVELVDHRTD